MLHQVEAIYHLSDDGVCKQIASGFVGGSIVNDFHQWHSMIGRAFEELLQQASEAIAASIALMEEAEEAEGS